MTEVNSTPRVLRLRSVALLPNSHNGLTIDDAVSAKRKGIDAFVHSTAWNPSKARQTIDKAIESSRDDAFFALCVVIEQEVSSSPAQTKDLVDALAHPNYLTALGRSMLFVYSSAIDNDLIWFTQSIRQASRLAGLPEPLIQRIAKRNELAGISYLPGVDGVIELPESCSCWGSSSASKPSSLSNSIPTRNCIAATANDEYTQTLGDEIKGAIENAIRFGEAQTHVFSHACEGWQQQTLASHDLGILTGMKHMPSFPPAAAPYEVGVAKTVRPALTIALVAQSNPEATMYCLQSVLDTSTDMGELQFVVIDNGTTDETSALLRELGESVRSTRNGIPQPIDKAWAQAIAMADGELVLLISNDVSVGAFWYEPLLKAFELDPLCTAVTPAVATGNTLVPTQPPTVNSGVCLLARGDAVRNGRVGDARYVDESIVHMRLESRQPTQ